MESIVVCDTSSLIKLYKGGVLHCLNKLFHKIVIPQAVKDECQNSDVITFLESDFVEIRGVQTILFESLGKGEREAVSLAVEANIKDIIIDDSKGFNKALSYELAPIQSTSIILLAKDKNLISSVQDVLDTMISNGEGITQEKYEETLRFAEEM